MGSGGGFVRATSPTLVTPVLGIATGTSIALTNTTNTKAIEVFATGITNEPVFKINHPANTEAFQFARNGDTIAYASFELVASNPTLALGDGTTRDVTIARTNANEITVGANVIVTLDLTADNFIRTAGTSDEILLGDGGVTSLATLQSSNADLSFKDITFATTINEAWSALRPNLTVDLTSFMTFNLTGTSNGSVGKLLIIRKAGGESSNIFLNGTSISNDTFETGLDSHILLSYIHDTEGLKWYQEIESVVQSVTSDSIVLSGEKYYNFETPNGNIYNYDISSDTNVGSIAYLHVNSNSEPTLRATANTTAGSFVVGLTYRIQTAGTTDFVAEQGTADNNFDTSFVAVAVGSGTGTAREYYTKLGSSVAWQNSTDLIFKVQRYPDAVKYEITNVNTTGDEPAGSDPVLNVVSLTQAEYDAGTPIATTLYNITDA